MIDQNGGKQEKHILHRFLINLMIKGNNKK